MEYHCEHTELVDPASLKPHPKNPHVHPDSQVKQLSEIITRIGWRLPIVVSRLSGCIVAGHCRRLAGLSLGCAVPVDFQDFANDTEELDFLMADNIIPELAEWDKDLKLSNLEELKLEDISFEVEDLSPSHEPSENEVDPQERLIVEVECSSELEQNEVFEMLTERGYKCKVMGI